jgi:hypothetical protein
MTGLRLAVSVFQTTGTIWLVDSTGRTHELDVGAYARLTGKQLEGSHVFLTAESAAEFVARNPTPSLADK